MTHEIIREGHEKYPESEILPPVPDKMDIYNQLRQPPPEALKQITGGRLKGMSDINPQWRYEAITEQFGACGVGWKYEVSKYWLEPASDGQVAAFAEVLFYYNIGKIGLRDWSSPVPGIGGSMFIVKEKSGLHVSDEAYKMAVTDALSVALKMIGVGADIYRGLWDGQAYHEKLEVISEKQAADLRALMEEVGANEKRFCNYLGLKKLEDLPAADYENAVFEVERKRK